MSSKPAQYDDHQPKQPIGSHITLTLELGKEKAAEILEWLHAQFPESRLSLQVLTVSGTSLRLEIKAVGGNEAAAERAKGAG